MKSLLSTPCLCLLFLMLTGCQAFPVPDVQSRLNNLDFNLDSSSYLVRPGETLESIAFRYKTSVGVLQQLNPDAARSVYAGMMLNVRPGAARARIRQTENLNENAVATAIVMPEIESSMADRQMNESSVVIAPARHRQAVPVTAVASDQFLLGRSGPEQVVNELPAIASIPSGGYVEQRGFPVEEVIDDVNFVLPTARGAVDEQLQKLEGRWQWPLNGQLAREYDSQRPNGQGIDVVGLPGQKVYATRDGVVDWVARSPDGVGKIVIIRHKNDYLSIYSNIDELFVFMKDTVSQGDEIASLGANAEDEPLLRFEISKDGKLLNPMDFLASR